MSAQSLSSRAIIGRFYKRLEQNVGASWIDGVSSYFPSDQSSEEYRFLGQSPAMREWIGQRHVKGLWDNGVSITNRHYEASLDIPVKDMRRDKTGQVMARVDDLADRANSHWASLLSALIVAGESTTCYDGQFFFDTDHTEGNNSTSQSNDLAITLSGLPVSVAGSATAPSVESMQVVIHRLIQAILGFRDNENEPMNENAKSFLVMVPVPFLQAAISAVYTGGVARGFASQTGMDALKDAGVSIAVAANVRLSSWTNRLAAFRTDASVKPLIRQEEMAISMKAKAEGSEYEFDNDAHQYGIDAWRNVGYGYWQHACLATLS